MVLGKCGIQHMVVQFKVFGHAMKTSVSVGEVEFLGFDDLIFVLFFKKKSLF